MSIGKILVCVGIALLLAGVLLVYFPGLFNWFGRLPGDISIKRENTQISIPLVSMIVISAILTVILNLFLRR